jgi:hypothetical protein
MRRISRSIVATKTPDLNLLPLAGGALRRAERQPRRPPSGHIAHCASLLKSHFSGAVGHRERSGNRRGRLS